LVASGLVAEGFLDAVEDVFFLEQETVTSAKGEMRERVTEGKARFAEAERLSLPLTTDRETIREIVSGAVRERAAVGTVFPGIALSAAVFEGKAVVASDLVSLLTAASREPGLLTAETVLVVGALEPSWAVVFPRVGAVVAEIGGELSHASILLREARKPAVVNCTEVLQAVKTGDRVRVDGARGVVELVG